MVALRKKEYNILEVHETLRLPGMVNDATKASYSIANVDSIEWLKAARRNSIQACVTDPPYGIVEYRADQLAKKKSGSGGVWRVPPTLDGHQRSPLPRFSILKGDDLVELHDFFESFGDALLPVLVPGAHLFIATNPLVSHIVYQALCDAGFEKRGEIIRVVQTLRGGDRPKNAHKEFPMVTVMPRSNWEPWGLFRKPLEGRVQDNLRTWQTGGLRRVSESSPFRDLITAAPARGKEREIAPHPSLKPQVLMRQLVRASLPRGKGIVLDPFMGSGSTIAAAAANGYQSIGLEKNSEFFLLAAKAIPKLAALKVGDV